MSRVIVRRGNVNNSAGLVTHETRQHSEIHQAGYDFDMDGIFSRLVRCKECGLLMRQYLPMA